MYSQGLPHSNASWDALEPLYFSGFFGDANLYQWTNALFGALWAPRFILRRQSTHTQPGKWNRHQRRARQRRALRTPSWSCCHQLQRRAPAARQTDTGLWASTARTAPTGMCSTRSDGDLHPSLEKKNPGRNGWQQAQWALSPEVGAEPQGGCCWLTLPLGRRRLLHSPGCCPPSSPTGPSTPVCHQHRAGGCRALLATVRTRSEQKEHCATEHFSISRWKHLIRCKSSV